MPIKPLTFIDLLQPATGRTSSFSIYGNNKKDSDKIKIVGGLEHGTHVVPKSVQDANLLIKWLKEWKESQK